MSEGLTLKKFEEASEIVNKVTLNTNLIYSDYFSEQTGNKVYIKPENMQLRLRILFLFQLNHMQDLKHLYQKIHLHY